MAETVRGRDAQTKWKRISTENTVPAAGRLTERHALSKAQLLQLLDPDDHRFEELHDSIDNLFRELRSSGVGSDTKSAEVITKDEEAQLWEKGLLGTNSTKALFRAVFFLNGRNFCLRGGDEHRRLKLSQIKRYNAPDCYVYTENSSKNRSGGMAQMRVAHKVAPIYTTPEAGALFPPL